MRLTDADALQEKFERLKEKDSHATGRNAYDLCAMLVEDAPTVRAVPLSEIYRVIAGHSNYHGDSVLAALTCIAEGKDVKPVRSLYAANTVEVKHGRWILQDGGHRCSNCDIKAVYTGIKLNYCPNCGAKMDL